MKLHQPRLGADDQDLLLILGLVLAFLLRIAWVLLVPSTPLADFADYDRLGWELAAQGTYTNGTGDPTAFRPPGYPFLLALVYRIAGHQPLAARLVNAGLGAITCLLLYRLTVRIGRRHLALPATVCYALYPAAVYYANLLATEVLFTFLLLTAVLIWIELTECRSSPPRVSLYRSLLALSLGGLVGLAALVRPVILPVFGLFLLFSIQRLRSLPRLARVLSLSLLALLVVILPWTYRNYQVSGRLALISTNGGVNFYIGNNAAATGGYFVPADNPFEGLTEWQMDQAGWEAGLQFMQEQPFRFLENSIIKAVNLFSLEWDAFFWNFQTPETFGRQLHSLRLVKQSEVLAPFFLLPLVTSAILLVLGLWGLKRVYTLPYRPLFIALIGAWIIVHMLVFANARFHFPLIPLLTISAVHLVHGWFCGIGGSEGLLAYGVRNRGIGDYLISLYTLVVVLSWGKTAIAKFTTYLF